MKHLSIRRQDRTPVRNWRHLQYIKNEILGPECEAVELFPKESRLNDEANQFHLFGYTSPENVYTFGYTTRRVGKPGTVIGKSQQAPWPKDEEPADAQ